MDQQDPNAVRNVIEALTDKYWFLNPVEEREGIAVNPAFIVPRKATEMFGVNKDIPKWLVDEITEEKPTDKPFIDIYIVEIDGREVYRKKWYLTETEKATMQKVRENLEVKLQKVIEEEVIKINIEVFGEKKQDPDEFPRKIYTYDEVFDLFLDYLEIPKEWRERITQERRDIMEDTFLCFHFRTKIFFKNIGNTFLNWLYRKINNLSSHG